MNTRLVPALLLLLVPLTATAAPSVKRPPVVTGTRAEAMPNSIHPRTVDSASLDNDFALVGTISCEACGKPFQPVAVVRQLATQRLLHLRVGDELQLKSGEHALVALIGSGFVDIKGAGQAFRLHAGSFPEQTSDDGTNAMIARTPPSYAPQSSGY